MVRKTKEEALATRDGILDAAELLFERQGVSRTTLQHIAAQAGVTRGAIYWHFKNKAHLFNCMMERAVLPLDVVLESVNEGADPLDDIRDWLLQVFRLTVKDEKARRVFDIALHKVEYVEELTEVRDRYLGSYRRWLQRVEGRLKAAKRQGLLKAGTDPAASSRALCALADGLLRVWLLDQQAFDLLRLGRRSLQANLDALRKPTA